MRGESAAGQMVGQMLERATVLPAGDWLYSVGGQPVFAMWGHSSTPLPPAPPPEPAKVAPSSMAGAAPLTVQAAAHPAADAMADLAATGASSSAAPAAERPGRRRWWIGALVGLALLALLVLFGLKTCSAVPDDLSERLAKAEAQNKSLEDEIALRKGQAPQFQCVRPPAPAASEPPATPVEPPAPEAPPPEPPKPDPLADLKRKIETAGNHCETLQAALKDKALGGKGAQVTELRRDITDRLQTHCKEKLIREAKNMCPGQRPKELAPELALVFDASGSMRYSLSVSPQELQRAPADLMQEMLRQLGGARGGGGGFDPQRMTREPTRMTAARQAAISLVRRAPSDANIGLVRIEGQQCSARSAGFYPPARRGQLIGELQGLQADGGTPLADGVAKGGQMVDGVRREALMVVISDGAESCGQDPCAVARQLKRAKPYLKINVVDITGTGAANCLAQITGGRVFTARNADEVAAMTSEASREAMAPANCPR
jgi:Mg-chelatase subunit ChlD